MTARPPTTVAARVSGVAVSRTTPARSTAAKALEAPRPTRAIELAISFFIVLSLFPMIIPAIFTYELEIIAYQSMPAQTIPANPHSMTKSASVNISAPIIL